MEAAMPDDYATDDDISLAIRDTEKEVFWSAVTGDDDGGGTNNQMVEDLSQAEGWDGDDLSMNEIAARTMHGDNSTNFDRPIAMETETTLAADNYHLRQQLDAVIKAYNERVATPEMEAARQQRRDAVSDHMYNNLGLISIDNAKLDQIIAREDAAAQDRVNRLEANFRATAQRHGKAFDDAFDYLKSMPVNERSSRLVKDLLETDNPGEMVMHFHGHPYIEDIIRTAPPFMPRGYGPPPRAVRQPRSSDSADGGWGDADVEADIFNSAFDNEGWY
jgi:hypothetical protein